MNLTEGSCSNAQTRQTRTTVVLQTKTKLETASGAARVGADMFATRAARAPRRRGAQLQAGDNNDNSNNNNNRNTNDSNTNNDNSDNNVSIRRRGLGMQR